MAGESSAAPAPEHWSGRSRIAVIVGLSVWLWTGLATIGHLALG